MLVCRHFVSFQFLNIILTCHLIGHNFDPFFFFPIKPLTTVCLSVPFQFFIIILIIFIAEVAGCVVVLVFQPLVGTYYNCMGPGQKQCTN